MSKRIEYIEEENYLIREFHGSFNSQEIYSSWELLINEKLENKNYTGIITDFSNAELNMGIDDLKQLISLFKENYNTFKDLKLAVIMTTPQNIVLPIFAQNNSPFNIKAFSTQEGARNWMLNK